MTSSQFLDIDQVRADTPACLDQAFLDGAGSALSPRVVLDTVIGYLEREQEVGGYTAQFEAEDRLNATLESCGRLVGVPGDRIALQTSATAAWMRALGSIPLAAGDRILMTGAEYASNVIPMLQSAKRVGISVEVIPNQPDGTTSPDALAEMLDGRVKIVAITHAPSQNGLVVDAEAIGAAIRKAKSQAWYLLDACQSVGQMPIDCDAIGADFLTATGRKWIRGPRGTGFLAMSSRAINELEPVPPDMFGTTWHGDLEYSVHGDASQFQSFEMPYGSILGLGAAADYALAIGMDAIRGRINTLAQHLRDELSLVPGVRIHDQGSTQSGIVVFSLPREDALAEVMRLAEQRITVVAMKEETNPAHFRSYEASCVLRASPHIYNTEDDLTRLVNAIRS